MDWAEDFKFSLKKSAKKGRRAKDVPNPTAVPSPDRSNLNLMLDQVEFTTSSSDDILSPPRSKMTGGWATDDIPRTAKSGSGTNVIEQERFNSISVEQGIEDDDIPIIPDLDDIQGEFFINGINEAPGISVNRVATYKELNSDFLKHSAFASLEDTDLSLLSRCLLPENELEEPDEVWNWEHLFTKITAEINEERPKLDSTPQFVN